MKAITTKYHGPTDVKGSRIIAADEDGNRIIRSLDSARRHDEAHGDAALALCAKMGWTGKLVGGGIKGGMVWVFTQGACSITAR